jgi:hypothetical protein
VKEVNMTNTTKELTRVEKMEKFEAAVRWQELGAYRIASAIFSELGLRAAAQRCLCALWS